MQHRSMNPSTLLLIVLTAGAAAMVRSHPAANTPAMQFWEQALPGTPMPKAIANLVQKGIDHSPLVKHYTAVPSINTCTLFNTVCDTQKVAEAGIFFHEAQLHPGSTMTVSFPQDAETPPILPHDVAEKVPFDNLRAVLSTFHISPDSAEAAQVSDTLRRCEEPPVAGEVKTCTTSLESTVQSAMEMLGTTVDDYGAGLRAVTSELPTGGLPRQSYVVQAVAPLAGSRYVSCHRVPFPYGVYQCHISMGYRAYVVSLRGVMNDDLAASALAFCHVDTSGWNPAHPAFEILGTHLGGTPVCHFMQYGDLAFIVQ